MQPDSAILLAVLAIPFIGAALAPLVHRVLGERTAYYAATIAALCSGLLISQYGRWGTVTVEWIPALDVSLVLYLDGLAFLIGLLASGIGVLVFIYSGGYMHGEPGQAKYYTTLLVFMGSMLGVALVVDLLSLFVFWELTSVASFLLIGHYQRADRSLYAARKAMFITVTGGLFMLIGFLLLGHVSSFVLDGTTFTLIGTEQSLIGIPGQVTHAEAIRHALIEKGLFVPAIGLIAIGAATKSAQIPFHIWLPDAMEAPTPVSAFLHSATMVKAGVYLIGRFRPLFVPEHVFAAEVWTWLFVGLGLATMTIAAMLAVSATDIKELLAYSTASHLGLIVAGFGFAETVGAETGAFHILNHAAFKATLFLVAGIIAHEAGTRSIDALGGLRHDMPIVAAITAVASLSMAGIPPFNGFYSKELLFDAAWETAHHFGGLAWLLPVVAVFGSIFTFLYSIRFLWLFFGDRPTELGEIHRPPVAMLLPAGVLAIVVLVLSLGAAPIAHDFVNPIVKSSLIAPAEGYHFSAHLPHSLKPPVLMSVVTIVGGIATYPFYDRLHHGIRRLRSVALLAPNQYYDRAITGIAHVSDVVPRYVQTDLMRTYAAVVMSAVSAFALGGYLLGGTGTDLTEAVTGVNLALPITIILAVAVIGALAVDRAPSHIVGVLTLSILGFTVAVFYVLASAPDLALTQLVIETLVLVLFLLVLDRLPAFYGELRRRRAVLDGVIAAAVGLTVTITVLVTTAADPSDGIAHYFVEKAPVPTEHGTLITDAGGGNNIVNVILVDFRALDTMGEISVVAMAALAILTLIGMRNRGERA